MFIYLVLLAIFAIIFLDYVFFAHGKIPIIWRFGIQHKRPYDCPCLNKGYAKKFNLKGEIIVITGGTEGIGKATALQLAQTGADVVITSRDEKKGLKVVEEIEAKVPGCHVYYKHLDLASFKSIRKFAQDIIDRNYGCRESPCKSIYALINNAGIMLIPDKVMTEDGFELTSAVNYFGPFLLSHLLTPFLRSSGKLRQKPSRIINVSSRAHTIGPTTVRDLGSAFNRNMVYGNSKLAVVMSTITLAQRCKSLDSLEHYEGCSLTAVSLHPGTVDTDLFKHVPQPVRYIIRRFFSVDAETGARTSVFCTLSPEIGAQLSGSYFSECQVAKASPKVYDKDIAERLWARCEEIWKNTS